MKNLLTFTSLVLVCSLVMMSCSKDELLTNEKSVENQEINDYLKLSDEEFKSILQNFTNEYAKFDSEREFHAFTHYFNNLEDEEQQNVLNELTYATLDEKLSEAYEGMDVLETEQEFYDYVSNYSDILEIQMMDNSEKEVVEKEMSLHSIAPFLNADRIVKVGGDYKMFISNIAVESNDYNELKEVLDSKKTLGLIHKEVYQIISGTDNLAKTDVGTTLSWEATKDMRRCKNDRKVILAAYFTDESITDPLGNYHPYVKPNITVTARRKGIPCIWYTYKTEITWNNFYAEYSVNFGPNATWSEANQKVNNVKSLTHDHSLINYYNSPDVTWQVITSTVTTRGMGTSNLTVNY